MSKTAKINKLQNKIKELEKKLSDCQHQLSNAPSPTTSAAARPKIAQMSAEVVDSNPYSRLMALKRMGIVDDYEVLHTSCIIALTSKAK